MSLPIAVVLHMWIVVMAHVALMSNYDKHHKDIYIYIYKWMKAQSSAQRCVVNHRFVKSGLFNIRILIDVR